MVRFLVFSLAITLVLNGTAGAQLATDSTWRDALSHYRDGQDYLAREQWERAAAAFQRAIKLEPLFTDARYGLGTAFMGLQRYVSAVQAFNGCIDAARTLHGLRLRDRVAADQRLADEIRELRETARRMQSQPSRALRGQQIAQRIQDLERTRTASATSFEPPAVVLLALGSAHFRQGDRDVAVKHWSEAVRVNTKLGEAWNNLAAVYAATGRRQLAEDALRQAEGAGFRVNPRLKEAVAALDPS